MGRSKHRRTSSDSEDSSSSSDGRYKSRRDQSRNEKSKYKRNAEEPLYGGNSKRTRPEVQSTIIAVASDVRQSSASNTTETRTNTPPLMHEHNSFTPIQSATSLAVESRVERLEGMLEILIKQGSSESRRVSLKSDCIPEFDPENENLSAEKWLQKIDQVKSINGWDDVTTIYQVQSRFTGMARSWYHSLTSYPSSWSEWKQLIAKTFPDHVDYAMMLRKMLQRTKQRNESMTTYYFNKMESLRTCQISGRNAVSCLIDGITNSTIQNAARAGRYVTPEALYEEYLSTLREDKFPECESVTYGRGNARFSKVRAPESRRPEKRFEKPVTKHGDFKNVQCFNCKSRGHYQTNCPKKRVECSKCHLLGHEAGNCVVGGRAFSRGDKDKQNTGEFLNILTIPKISNDCYNKNTCYFIDCVINGESLRGYVDSGCGAVTIRQSEVDRLGLLRNPTSAWLRGFAGGTVHVNSKVSIHLTVDLASADTEALVVPDDAQNIPIIVGQPFINNKNVTVLIQGDQIRLFSNEKTFSHLNNFANKKVSLYAAETAIIPSYHIGHIAVYGDDNIDDVFVDLQYRDLPGNFHIIPRGVTNLTGGGYISIMNSSDKDVCYKKDQVVARGLTCYERVDDDDVPMMSVEITKLQQIALPDIKNQFNPNLSIHEQDTLLKLINNYRDCFATNLTEVGKTNVTKMTITLSDDTPVTYRPYRMPFSEREVVRGIVRDLMQNDIIRESNSPYSSPVLLVKKKTGEFRMCIDYRALNRKTVKDKYPLPRMDDLLDSLNGSKYFTTLDLASGYHQIPLDEESVPKTAFVTPDGHFEFLRVPFGLANAPAVFQRAINRILGPLRFETAMAYLDDVLIPSVSIKEGIERLESILKLFRTAGLTLRLSKCSFLQENIEYLGHEISNSGIRPGVAKIKAVSGFRQPKDVHEVRRFLGLASYFRKFIKGFAETARPISSLTKKNINFSWGVDQHHAFETLKTKLCERPVLAIYNREAATEVHCDASKVGLGAILLQTQSDGCLKPVQYYSRTTTEQEQKYHSYELEALAVVEALKKFRIYLIGIKFKVLTDCNSLRYTLMKRDLVPRI